MKPDNKVNVLDAAVFAEALQRVARSLVKIRFRETDSDPVGIVCGWFVTDDLIIAPSLGPGNALYFSCEYLDGQKAVVIHASPVATGGHSLEEGIVLLRTKEKVENAALPFATGTPEPGQLLLVAQYPNRQLLSFGTVRQVEDVWLNYDVAIAEDSIGSPVLDPVSGEVFAMHMFRMLNSDLNEKRGLRVDAILKRLRNTDCWPEIVSYHKIVSMDVAATPKLSTVSAVDKTDILAQAALSWQLDPSALSEEERTLLKPLVIDKDSDTWMLKPSDRQRILTAPGSLKNLAQKRDGLQVAFAGQSVIDRIVKGPPYHIDEVSEEDLPYWLQAVRWFGPVIPELPTALQVTAAIEKRKSHSRLTRITSGFSGRRNELKKLEEWYLSPDSNTIVLSGIGGIGKSALVARFVLSLPGNVLTLWLDFDRADLSADNAASVLQALIDQAATQVDGLDKSSITVTGEAWEDAARKTGELISSARRPVLLVLDGFEIAQQMRQYDLIWKVLDEVMSTARNVKVIVSGRAPVTGLQLNGAKAESLHLGALEAADVEAWLKTNGIENSATIATIAEMSAGIPLRLKLALRYIKEYGTDTDLSGLSKEFIEGYLYTRILNRIVEPELKAVAKELLVLRKFSSRLVADLFKGRLPKIGNDSSDAALTEDEVFEKLSRELSLVNENNAVSFVAVSNESQFLELRPEVRTATLRLLETDDPVLVKTVDYKAAQWYSAQDLTNVTNLAELIYHELRLGLLYRARNRWRIECAPLLKYAVDDLPQSATAERDWLKEKLGMSAEAEETLTAWETETALKISYEFARGGLSNFDNILLHRKERTTDSPLVIYDAWQMVRENKLWEAADLLKDQKAIDKRVQRNRDILAAFVARRIGRQSQADHLLSSLETSGLWDDRPEGKLEALAVRAARVRLLTNVTAELSILETLKFSRHTGLGDVLKKFLSPADVILPLLNEELAGTAVKENYGTAATIPDDLEKLPRFREYIKWQRQKGTPFVLSLDEDAPQIIAFQHRIEYAFSSESVDLSKSSFVMRDFVELAYVGYRRWKMAGESLLMYELAKEFRDAEVIHPLQLSIVSTLAAYRGQMISVPWGSRGFLDRYLRSIIRGRVIENIPPPDRHRHNDLKTYLEFETRYGYEHIKNELSLIGNEISKPRETSSLDFLKDVDSPHLISIVLYLQGPDPLEMLVRRVLGYSDREELGP